jgi:ketosteroid isomerase-like protein
MSQENVDLVLRVLGQGRRNPTALFDVLDDAVHWDVGFLDIPDSAGTWHGPAAVREFFRRWVGAFDEWDYEVGNVIDAEDSVVVRVHQWGRGEGSGVSVDSEFWQVWTIRNGKVVRWGAYATEADALEALGLRE